MVTYGKDDNQLMSYLGLLFLIFLKCRICKCLKNTQKKCKNDRQSIDHIYYIPATFWVVQN